MYLEFDKETELFKGTDDPATETLRQLQAIITELAKSGEPTQKAIIEAVKKDDVLEHLGRDTVRSLLKKGDGIFWHAERRPAMKNAVVYLPKSAYEHSTPFIEPENSNTAGQPSESDRKQEQEKGQQGAINPEFANIQNIQPEYSNTASGQDIPFQVSDDCPALSEDDLQSAGWL